MIHIDYRKTFERNGISFELLCLKCGDLCLTDFDDDGNACNKCTNCGVIKIET